MILVCLVDKPFYKSMRLNAGIFPESIEILDRFAERYLQDIPEIDFVRLI